MTEFLITGFGSTRRAAALEFVENLHKKFPNKKGIYEVVIRSPFTYDKDLSGGSETHCYRLKGSFTQLKKFDKETNVVSLVK